MHWIIEPVQQWSQITTGWNWRTFNLLNIEIEDDRMMGAVEVNIVLIGLGIRVRCIYTETETARQIKNECDNVMRDV